MFKTFLFTVLLSIATLSQAQLVPAESVADAVKQAEQKCSTGCLVLSPEQIAALQAALDAAIQKAYLAGQRHWANAS